CFFFQAEDGIRDGHVTGVQTCALPICTTARRAGRNRSPRSLPLPSSHHASRSSRSLKRLARRRRAAAPVSRRIASGLRGQAAREIGRASCRERGEVTGVVGG